jgi:hypothetical protein
LRFLVVLSVVIFDSRTLTRTLGLVDQSGGRDSDALTSRLEAELVGTVLHNAHLPQVVHISVLAHHFTGRQLRLDLKAAVRTFVPIRVRAVLVVPATSTG